MSASKHIKNFSIIFALAVTLPFFVVAQKKKSKTELQKERQQHLEKIQETEKILEETEQAKKNSLGELVVLNRRINQQEGLVSTIKNEVSVLNDDIDEDNQIIEALQKDISDLKEEYAAMLFAAQKASGQVDKLTLLFSAQSFDQLLMRLKYMNQYGKARKEQADAIAQAQSMLEDQVKQTEKKRTEKKSLLSDELKQSEQLTTLKQKQRTVVRSLEKEEKRLKRELEETKKAVAELDDIIAKIVREELERAAREAKLRDKGKSSKEAESALEKIELSSTFEKNKNKLPWPVAGFVSQKYGRHPHPLLKGIEVQNDGVNIQTKQNEPVRSVFNGEVRAVAFIRGKGNTLILSHGEYYTVYCGLKDVFVKTGQKVTTSEELGRVRSTPDGTSELLFQIRKNTATLDPEEWLKN